MTRWIDRMSSADRDTLRDAGRLGNTRFDGPPPPQTSCHLPRWVNSNTGQCEHTSHKTNTITIMNTGHLRQYINQLPIAPSHRIKLHRLTNLVESDLLAAVEALERLTDAAEPITKDDSPDHVFVPSHREWQEFELAQVYARAVLRRLRGKEGDR